MTTECSADRFEFARVEGRGVVAGFDGGTITSDAGALLLGATDRATAWSGGSPRASSTIVRPSRSSIAWPPWSASGCSRLRWATRIWSTTTPCATTRCWPRSPASSPRAVPTVRPGGQVDPQPARDAPAGAATRYQRIGQTERRSSGCSSSCSSTHTGPRQRRSCWTWMPPTIRCTEISSVASSTVTTRTTAICRSTFFVASICCVPNCDGRTSMRVPERSSRCAAGTHSRRLADVRIILRADSGFART